MSEQLELLSTVEHSAPEVSHHRIVVRESARARRMFLHVQPPGGIEVVVPRGTRPVTVRRFVESNRQWIEAAHAKISREYTGDRSAQPAAIRFPALGRTIDVAYRTRMATRRRWLLDGDRLEVLCSDRDHADAPEILRAWLMREARIELPARVAVSAAKIGVEPQRVQVRLQRTRWGSCSSSGTISINAVLLLLEAPLIEYLIVHELCHMRHMNHSRAYWRLVERYEPNYRRLDAELARAWQRMPWWAVAGRSAPA